jgi:tyrosyl-DNA phosphodiesterase 2
MPSLRLMLSKLTKLGKDNSEPKSPPVITKFPLAFDSETPPFDKREVSVAKYSTGKHEWTPLSLSPQSINRVYVPAVALRIRFVSWNIDFMVPEVHDRLTFALRYIQNELLKCEAETDAPEPCCILLQEVHRMCFSSAILSDPWIQKHFTVTPDSRDGWPDAASYGVVTLVSKNVPVIGAYSLDFLHSNMSRNALFVDIAVRVPQAGDAKPRPLRVRVANVHLESLGTGAQARQEQLEGTSQELLEEDVFVGVVAGDMNAFAVSDRGLPESFGLTDAWVSGDSDEAGFTWGYQPKARFPADR